MQTYTHAAIGAVIGTVFFRNNALAQAVCVIGACGPDTSAAMAYIVDKTRGKKPLATIGSLAFLLLEIGHSIPVWAVTCFALSRIVSSDWNAALLAFTVGWISHILIDIPTHGLGSREKRPLFWDRDVSFMYPLSKWWPILDLRRFGVWEYRYGNGILWPPKPFEAIVLCLAVSATMLLWIV